MKNSSENSHMQTLHSPARIWKDGFPCGNGKMGAILYGGIQTERILVNDESWYYRAESGELPDVSGCLPEVRQLLEAGQVERANSYYEEHLRGAGYNPEIAVFQPGFDILLERKTARPFLNYSRSLNMETGEARVAWDEGECRVQRRLFVSRSHNIVAFEHKGTGPHEGGMEIRIQAHDFRDAIYQDGKRFTPELSSHTSVEGDTLVLKIRDNRKKTSVFGIVRIIACDQEGSVHSDPENVSLRTTGRILVLARSLAKGSGEAEVESAIRELQSLSGNYGQLFGPSMKKHQELYNRVRFSLGSTRDPYSNEQLLLTAHGGELSQVLVEKLWNYGRYLLICSSSPDGLPSHLQGIWNGDYDPPWQCFYMANENIQMNYWQALPGNLPEMAEPLYTYYEGLMDDFRENARRLFGCRGIYLPAATAPDTGLPKLLHSHIIYWISGAGWIAQHFYDYWRFTGDRDFLRDRALPFMREVAEFYEDYLVADDAGVLRFSPSISPENSPPDRVRDWADGGSLYISEDATMDVAVCRELFHNLIEGAEVTGLYAECLEKWKGLVEKLPDYQVNEDGAIREWMHPDYPDNYNHRHLSHLYPVFPGNEVSKKQDPERFAAFVQAVELRLDIGLHEQTGWSLAHMANIHARLGNGERALECLRLLAQVCLGQNLFTYHNDYRRSGITMDLIWGETAPFQIDANMGWTAAVMEMLVQSHPGHIQLLPALPESWRTGKLENLRARGQVDVTVEWDFDRDRIQATLVPQHAGMLHVGLPDRARSMKQRVRGAEIHASNEADNILELEVKAGGRLEIDLRT